MKRPSEAAFGKALRAVNESVPVYVYRPPDAKAGAGVSNPKPCDYMAWALGDDNTGIPDIAWFEVKDTPAVQTWPLADLRPSQLQGIREAKRLGIPYWLAIYWRRHRDWTISDAVRLITFEHGKSSSPRSVPRELLMTRYGISSLPGQLTSTLKSVLAGELGG